MNLSSSAPLVSLIWKVFSRKASLSPRRNFSRSEPAPASSTRLRSIPASLTALKKSFPISSSDVFCRFSSNSLKRIITKISFGSISRWAVPVTSIKCSLKFSCAERTKGNSSMGTRINFFIIFLSFSLKLKFFANF